jgi:hypothetical protein
VSGAVTKLYALPLVAHDRVGVKVSSICWGSCGHGLIGGIVLGDLGEAIPCAQPADRCPAFVEELPHPWGTVHDGQDPERPVYLRKIREPWRVIKPPLRERLRKAWIAIRYAPNRARVAVREWWKPTCKECGWPMKEHKPKAEPDGKVYMRRPWGYGIDHIRAVDVADGVLFEVAAVHCTGEVDSILLTYSDVEALRDALDAYLAERA